MRTVARLNKSDNPPAGEERHTRHNGFGAGRSYRHEKFVLYCTVRLLSRGPTGG